MGWKEFDAFMFLLGVVLIIVYFTFDFSATLEPYTLKSVLLSIIVGVWFFLLFVFFANLGLPPSHNEKHEKLDKEASLFAKHLKMKKRRNHIFGVIFMLIIIVIFLNFYLSFRAMLGNDMLVSLKVDNPNLEIKNGETSVFSIKASVLTNPFCQSNCSLILEDLGTENILDYENIYLQFSSPVSKDYSILSNEESFGQKLYKITLDCITIEKRFCHASTFAKTNTSNARTKIISVNYNLNDEQSLKKEELKNKTESLNKRVDILQKKLLNLNMNFSYLDLSELEKERGYLLNASYLFSNKINTLNDLYKRQKYSELEREIFSVEIEIGDLENRFNLLNNSFFNKINIYNSLVNDIDLLYNESLYLEDYNFSNSSIVLAEKFISDFNSMISEFKEDTLIETKEASFNYVSMEKENLVFLIDNEILNGVVREDKLNHSFSQVNLSKIFIEERNYTSEFILPEPLPICCFKDECYGCIDDSSLNYPVILVHGHSFNEKLSAELSMEAFSDMARDLDKEGYLDAGYFYGSQYSEELAGYLGKVNAPVVVEATYYLDTKTTEEGDFIYDSKWESIDTYSGRLNEVVSNVKYLTGKDKVILVAHSMGGLVTRRYMHLYGTEDVDRVVLIGVPNHGVDGFVLEYCPVFGADIECNEMNKNSVFINELNKNDLPDIPLYNIVGLGCDWEGSIGDGIVKNESAHLEGIENIYVNGTCKGVDFFHVNMIKPSKYPDIYELVKELIEI